MRHEYFQNLSIGVDRSDDRRNLSEVVTMHEAHIERLKAEIERKDAVIKSLRWLVDEMDSELTQYRTGKGLP